MLLVYVWLSGKFDFSSISALCSKTVQGWVLVEEGWMRHLYNSATMHMCYRGLFDLCVPARHPWGRGRSHLLCLAGPAALGSCLAPHGVTGQISAAFLAGFPGLLKGWRGLEKLGRVSLQRVVRPHPVSCSRTHGCCLTALGGIWSALWAQRGPSATFCSAPGCCRQDFISERWGPIFLFL